MVSVLLATVLALGSGCVRSTEGARQLNHQNESAGRFIAESSSQPDVAQAGADVAANAAVLREGLIGVPENPVPYSPENSAAARKQAKEEQSAPWWKWALGIALGIATGGGIGWKAGGVARAALGAVVEGIARVREKAQASGGSIAIPDLLSELVKAQSDPRVRELVKTIAHKKEAELERKM